MLVDFSTSDPLYLLWNNPELFTPEYSLFQESCWAGSRTTDNAHRPYTTNVDTSLSTEPARLSSMALHIVLQSNTILNCRALLLR